MRSRLILINGVPASGKTTLAQRWAESHAMQLPLCIDIDAIRSMIGGWRDAMPQAGIAARDIAVAGIEAQLRSGRDAVVPQYLHRREFIDRLEITATGHGAIFVETALFIDAPTAEARFLERSERLAEDDTHGSLSADMATVVRDFEGFLASRPRAIRFVSGDDALLSLEAAIHQREADSIGR
ncbi:hypothetical protein GCM10028798_23940 [Humibacter antri]